MRRYKRRKTPYKKRPYYRKGSSKTVGAVALKEVRKLKKTIEVKDLIDHHVITLDATHSEGQWCTPQPLIKVTRGTTPTTRVGSKITIQSISMRGIVKMTSLTSPDVSQGNHFRMMIFMDRRPDLVAITNMSKVLQIIDTTNKYWDLLNTEPANKGRFQILADSKFRMPENITVHPFEYYKKKIINVELKDGPTYDDVAKNQLYLAFASERYDNTDASTNAYVEMACRFKFTDA